MCMEQVEDVAIVGAGPAGAYCAYRLARKGIYPIIFDDSHPREKPCGGSISPLAIEKFPFINGIPSKGSISAEFRIISPSGREAIAVGRRKGFNISRRYLDESILKMAIEAGARLANERVIQLRNEGNWRIKTKKHQFAAKTVVGADGVNSIVRKEVIGPIPPKNLGLGYGYIATGCEQEYTTMKFLEGVPGYIWIFPRDNHSSIGIGSELTYGSMLRKLLDDFIKSHYPNIRIISRFAGMLPLVVDHKFFDLPCAGKDWILVGDAAGHVDPISGEGILYALWSGELAAGAIQRSNTKCFDEVWRQQYGNHLRERCKQRATFYNPVMIELLVILASRSKTYSRLFYDISKSEQDYETFFGRDIRELPKTG